VDCSSLFLTYLSGLSVFLLSFWFYIHLFPPLPNSYRLCLSFSSNLDIFVFAFLFCIWSGIWAEREGKRRKDRGNGR
jgi:hypothetical protein